MQRTESHSKKTCEQWQLLVVTMERTIKKVETHQCDIQCASFLLYFFVFTKSHSPRRIVFLGLVVAFRFVVVFVVYVAAALGAPANIVSQSLGCCTVQTVMMMTTVVSLDARVNPIFVAVVVVGYFDVAPVAPCAVPQQFFRAA